MSICFLPDGQRLGREGMWREGTVGIKVSRALMALFGRAEVWEKAHAGGKRRTIRTVVEERLAGPCRPLCQTRKTGRKLGSDLIEYFMCFRKTCGGRGAVGIRSQCWQTFPVNGQ